MRVTSPGTILYMASLDPKFALFFFTCYNLIMTKQAILNTIKKFQHLSDKTRQQFFSAFEKKMLYRTTKTENPETSPQMVEKVLSKYAAKA